MRSSRKLPATVRLIYGGPGNQRGACGKVSGGRKTFPQPCGSFPGVPETSAELAASFRGVAKPSRNRAAHFRGSRKPARSLRQGFGGSQKLPATVRLIYGSPGNQRGVCGKVSGGRKTFRGMRGSFRLFFHDPAILSADHISAVRRNCYFYSSVILFCVVT